MNCLGILEINDQLLNVVSFWLPYSACNKHIRVSVSDLGLGIKRGNELINLGRFDRLLPVPSCVSVSDTFAGYKSTMINNLLL